MTHTCVCVCVCVCVYTNGFGKGIGYDGLQERENVRAWDGSPLLHYVQDLREEGVQSNINLKQHNRIFHCGVES